MKRVLQTEQQANLETVRRNVDIARASALLVAPGKDKESPLAPALVEALVARGAPAPRVVSACVCRFGIISCVRACLPPYLLLTTHCMCTCVPPNLKPKQ